MKPVIEIHELGKKYRIAKSGPYLSLRDELSKAVRNIFRKESKNTQDFWALQDITLTIEKGERLGIIGRNGAGKSTLLKILSRVTWPTTGSALIRGRLASLLEVGTGFHPELTGRENIYLNGSILGLKRAEINKQFDAIVDFSGVETFLDTPLKNYSSGMQLRLAFAVAAHLEPEVLLIDEVLAVGDMEFQKKCIKKMEEVSKEHGRTILFVSHQMNAVRSLCTHAIWLDKGKLKQKGTTAEIIGAYIESVKDPPHKSFYKNDKRSGSYYFDEIRLMNPVIHIGQDVMIHFTFNEKFRNRSLILNINIHDESGDLISHIINEDDHYQTESATKEIKVTLKELNIRPGKYFLSFWAGFDMHHEIDCIEKALVLEIDENNTFTHRITAFPSNSKIIIRSKWQAD